MAKYCREVGASLAPHVKTTMSPQIAQMQIEHGAWALAVANYSQARIFLYLGFIGGRGGIRDNTDAQAIAGKVAQDSRLIIRGVSDFERIVAGADRSSDGMAKVRECCQKIVVAAKLVAPYGSSQMVTILMKLLRQRHS